MHMYVYVYVFMYVYLDIHMYKLLLTCHAQGITHGVQPVYVCVYSKAQVCVCIYVCMYACTYSAASVYTCMYVCMYVLWR